MALNRQCSLEGSLEWFSTLSPVNKHPLTGKKRKTHQSLSHWASCGSRDHDLQTCDSRSRCYCNNRCSSLLREVIYGYLLYCAPSALNQPYRHREKHHYLRRSAYLVVHLLCHTGLMLQYVIVRDVSYSWQSRLRRTPCSSHCVAHYESVMFPALRQLFSVTIYFTLTSSPSSCHQYHLQVLLPRYIFTRMLYDGPQWIRLSPL